MSFDLADVVISINGRDAGKRFIVVEIRDEYSLIADGKGRRIEKPKLKKNKHLKLEEKADGPILTKLKENERVSNNDIRRFLRTVTDRKEEGGM